MAAKVLATEMYVAVDPRNNNNKFWKWERLSETITEEGKKGVMETGDLRITWGRVGAADPESQLRPWSESFVTKKVKEKTGKKAPDVPYTKVEVISTEVSPPLAHGSSVSNDHVKRTAVKEIAGGCKITSTLVEKLAKLNKHQLAMATGGKMDIDLSTGIVSTALGVVTLDAVKDARHLLDIMAPFVQRQDTDNNTFTDTLGRYLRLVPQSVGYKRNWHLDFLKVPEQTSLLDQLETSVELAEQRMTKAIDSGDVKRPSMFECKLALLEDKTVWKSIETAYFETVRRGHSCAHLKPVRVYEVTIPHMVASFEKDGKKIGNIQRLWHGTRVFNVLSILQRGFMLPTQLSTAQTTGAMFGNGLYFSDQSTKSLNYSRGGVWSSGVDSVCYMFMNDVAMGKMYIPSGPCNGQRIGYDSCYAIGGKSGVINNEMIVYRTSQCNPTHLIEFSE